MRRGTRVGASVAGSRQRGFTLIEILLATVLLAMGLALGFATLRAATATVERAEALARDSERVRMASGFLRGRLQGALPIAFETDTRTGVPQRFVGEPERMRFVAELPAYLGRGGPALHDLQILRDGRDVVLAVSFSSVVGGTVFEESQARPPEPLASALAAVHFSYRGIDATGAPTGWLERWEGGDELPLQVRIEVQPRQGAPWPPVLVALPQGSGRMNMAGEVVP